MTLWVNWVNFMLLVFIVVKNFFKVFLHINLTLIHIFTSNLWWSTERTRYHTKLYNTWLADFTLLPPHLLLFSYNHVGLCYFWHNPRIATRPKVNVLKLKVVLSQFKHNSCSFFKRSADKVDKHSVKMTKEGGMKTVTCSNGHSSTPNGRADDEGGGGGVTPRVSYAAAARKAPSPQVNNTPPQYPPNSGYLLWQT